MKNCVTFFIQIISWGEDGDKKWITLVVLWKGVV